MKREFVMDRLNDQSDEKLDDTIEDDIEDDENIDCSDDELMLDEDEDEQILK
jgi:hypothetical protein